MTGRIGLAMSGGGSRAAAFHLGCLRALHDFDLLDRIEVVSGVSGGALLAATWAYGPERFDDFDDIATALLRRGLQADLVRRVIAPAVVGRVAASAVRSALPGHQGQARSSWGRTDALAQLLDERVFCDANLCHPTLANRSVVITATDLRTGAAVRFGSSVSSCSRYGRIEDGVTIGTAVAASAAYPILLPTLDRDVAFKGRDGTTNTERVLLSDGGIYDNLGLSVLQPGRSRQHTDHVYDVTHIISCDAGRGPLALRSPRSWWGRNARAFEVVHAQAQNHGRGRLHEWKSSEGIDGFVMAYLGQRDNLLPTPPADLVPAAVVAGYPTDFAAMAPEDFTALTTRGEQVTRILLPHYCPELLA